ncbi:OmpA family protein [Spirosoma sp. KNUC1025]|uniref:OmpA family protein n=1 Tax=Spirosoma sp. KNUC1025 TaxID=2894082 RepID=UPI0038650224|nr:OmpA family protein [Spirosoma sp. KNUC1025]
MKLIRIIGWVMFSLAVQQGWAQSGLKGEYYVGTNFERKVFTRIDPTIYFNWRGRNPAPGVPTSYYSIRWTGKLLAPVTGKYDFFAKVDDGIRVWVGNKKVLDSWQLNDSRDFSGSVILKGGQYYDLRVDFFNDLLEGEIQLYWQRPDKRQAIENPFVMAGEPIMSQYFFQKAAPAAIPPKPSVVVAKPTTVAPVSPKPTVSKRAASVIPKPSVKPSTTNRTIISDTVATRSIPTRTSTAEQLPDIKPGITFILHHVQFEQSSYVLLPESSVELNKLVRAMETNPQWHIHIVGHTDNVGDSRLNLALSEQRAKVVATYLVRRGIADDRITTEGFGGKYPLADNAVESERSKNRRVEITVR